jgi:FxLD family lantipeptide
MNETPVPEFTLDVTLVDAGPAATGYATSTDDGCGSGNTGSTACTGRSDTGN